MSAALNHETGEAGGSFHGHVGWVIRRDELDAADHSRLAPDVSGDDPWMRVMDRGPLFMLPGALTGVLCFAVAGWRGVLWGHLSGRSRCGK